MDVNWMQKQFGATLIRRNSRIFLVLASLPAKSPRNESRRWSLGQITVSITAKRESLLKKTCFLLHVNSRKRKSKYCPMWISESGKSLPVESGIQEIFLVEFEILGFGIPITIWIRIRILLTKNPASSSLNPESTTWNPESKTVLGSLTRGDISLLMWCRTGGFATTIFSVTHRCDVETML